MAPLPATEAAGITQASRGGRACRIRRQDRTLCDRRSGAVVGATAVITPTSRMSSTSPASFDVGYTRKRSANATCPLPSSYLVQRILPSPLHAEFGGNTVVAALHRSLRARRGPHDSTQCYLCPGSHWASAPNITLLTSAWLVVIAVAVAGPAERAS